MHSALGKGMMNHAKNEECVKDAGVNGIGYELIISGAETLERLRNEIYMD